MVTKKLFTIKIVAEERKGNHEHIVIVTAESSAYPEKVYTVYNVPKPKNVNRELSSDILARYYTQKTLEEILRRMEKYKTELKEPEKVTFT